MHTAQPGRVDWVDYAKGFCIVMVVAMHATLGVEAQAGRDGWMRAAVEFAKPFQMPAFFLVSGLFLGYAIDRDWRTYLDRKVLHFAYFYVLWLTIQFAFKAPGMAAGHGWEDVRHAYFAAFVEPYGALTFIYLLPIFFVVTKLARDLSPLVVWLAAAMIQVAHIQTGWTVIDQFADQFVYFYTGYVLGPYLFEFAASLHDRRVGALIGLALWGFLNGAMVVAGWAALPFISLALGLAGAGAMVAAAALMAAGDLCRPLRECGRNWGAIYLAFVLPMSAALTYLPVPLAKAGIALDPGTLSLLVAVCAVAGPLALCWVARRTPLHFLFERPRFLRLRPQRRAVLQPAE